MHDRKREGADLTELCASLEHDLLRYCRSKMGRHARSVVESADMVQQVMLEFLAKEPSENESDDYFRVLAGLRFRLKCRILNTQRLHKCRPSQELIQELQAASRKWCESQGEITWSDTKVWIERFVDRLPKSYGPVVRLRTLEGREWDEIAEELSINSVAAQKRFQRAVHVLRDRLAARQDR